jgi:hypothetical protein
VFATVPVTLTVIVQDALAATEPPLSATLPLPATAVTVPAPQVVAALGVAAIDTPLGSVSVKAMPLSATAPEAVFGIVIVSVEVPPAVIDVGENAFAIESAAGVIVKFAVAALPFETLCVSLRLADGMLLV